MQLFSANTSSSTNIFSVRTKFFRGSLSILILLYGNFFSIANSQIKSDAFAPRNQQATIHKSANGGYVVNIQTPSPAGVSRNTYSQFDVPTQGAILNNARKGANTHLAGPIKANPWLAKGAARVILNEVNSSNPSQLRGFIEVGGQRAEVIVANPSGITCNGCGFINASKSTLTTGTVNVGPGGIQSIDVSRGMVKVEGLGLDASDTNYAAIIAKNVEINGKVYAQNLSVIAGENVVTDLGVLGQQVQSKNAQGSDGSFGIDVSQLGGMYAGKIMLKSTDQGVGVRNAGELGASFNEITLTADGRLINSGSMQSNQVTAINVHSVENKGIIGGKHGLQISAPKGVINQGTLIEENAAAGIELKTNTLHNSGNIVSNGPLRISAPERIDNSGQMISNAANPFVLQTLTLNNAGLLESVGPLQIQAVTLDNQTTGVIKSHATLEIAADHFNNTGMLNASGHFNLNLQDHFINAGQMISQSTDAMVLDLTQMTNKGVFETAGSLTIRLQEGLDNQGTIRVLDRQNGLRLDSQSLNNTGRLESVAAVILNVQDQIENSGQVISESAVSITAHDLENRGTLASQAALDLNLRGDLINHGVILSESVNQGMRINALNLSNTASSVISSQSQLALNVTNHFHNQGVVLAEGAGSLDLRARTLNNQGTLGSHQSLSLLVSGDASNTGQILAESGTLRIDAHNLNQSGSIGSLSGLDLTLTGNLFNSGNILSQSQGDSVRITAATLTQTATGTLGGKGDIVVNVSGQAHNSGSIFSDHTTANALILNAGTLTNATTGEIGSKGGLAITTQATFENAGNIIAQGTAAQLEISAAMLNNSGLLGSLGGMQLTATQTVLNTGNISTENDSLLAINAGRLTQTNAGSIVSQAGLALIAQDIDNAGMLVAQGLETATTHGVSLQANTLNNSGVMGSQSGLTLNVTSSLTNSGQIVTESQNDALNAGLIINTASLNNTATGSIGSKGDYRIHADTFNNSGKLISENSNVSMNLTGNELVNTSTGTIGTKGTLDINFSTVINNQGVIVAEGMNQQGASLLLHTATLNNSGQIEGKGSVTLNASNLTNLAAGSIGSEAAIIVRANALINQGNFKAGTRLTITSDNATQSGGLYAGERIDLAITQGFNNSGTISAQDQIDLTANNFVNLGLLETKKLNLTADSLTNQAGTGHFNVEDAKITTRIFENHGELSFNDFTLRNSGQFTNTGTITASDADIQTTVFQNTATGALLTDTLSLTAHSYLQNAGIIDGIDVLINTAQLDNLPNAMIFGDQLLINATTLNNTGTDVGAAIAGNDGGIIAGRDFLGIGTENLTNAHHGLLFSMGDLEIGRQVDADGIVTGSANSLTNHGARIESLFNMVLSANTVTNSNRYVSVGFQSLGLGVQFTEFEYASPSNPALVGKRYLKMSPGVSDLSHFLVTPDAHLTDINDGAYYYEYNLQKGGGQSILLASDPGKIIAGADLQISGSQLNNNQSTILAGRNLYLDGIQVNNSDVIGNRALHTAGVYSTYRDGIGSIPVPVSIDEFGSFNLNVVKIAEHQSVGTLGVSDQDFSNLRGAYGGLIQFNGDAVAMNGSAGSVQNNGTAVTGGGSVQNQNNLAGSNLTAGNINTQGGAAGLPAWNQSYYSVNARYARGRHFTDLGYLLSGLDYNNNLIKRLGDGFYEQRLIQEQVFKLTGSRFIDDYSDDEQQFKALMNNALAVKDGLQLIPGVALSASQVAALTNSIVWMVEKEVTLDNGTKTVALVPVVYAKPGTPSINTDGALISANRLIIDTQGNFTNEGSLLGKTDLVVLGYDITNKGLMQGGDLRLMADHDINVLGGTVLGTNSAHLIAGNDISVTTTTSTSTHSTGSITSVNRVGGVFVTGQTSTGDGYYDGTLVMDAGRDVTLTGAVVSNQADNGYSQITAGRDVNLNTISTGESFDSRPISGVKNYSSFSRTSAIGSEIQTVGDVDLSAGRDISLRASLINSDRGDIAMSAGRDINILEAHDSFISSNGQQSTKKRLLSKTTTTKTDAYAGTSSVGSIVSGENVMMSAGNDLNVRGSQVVANRDLIGLAGNNINITASEDVHTSVSTNSSRKTGIMGSGQGSFGFTIGERKQYSSTDIDQKTVSGSLLASVGGDVILSAGNTYNQIGSDVHAYGENGGSGDIYIRAKTVNIIEAREEKTVEELTKFKQSGLTVQVSHPVISAIQTLNSLNNNLKEVDDGHKNRMSAVAAGAAALSLKNNYDAFNSARTAGLTNAGIKNAASNAVANASNKTGGLNVSVTVGTESSRSNVKTTESTSRGSSISASGNAYIQSTAGDITIQGSSVKAGRDLTLDAARNINILASKDTRETDAKRSNANGSVGLNFGSNGIGVSFSGGAGRGVGEGEDVFYNQSYVTAGNTLTILSGGDTNIIGGIVSGDKVRARIGGDLHIESVQDIERSKSRDYGGGATLTIGYGWFTVTANANYDSFNNDYKSVKQQSGIFAGDQGFDVTVKGNTNLIGAVIAGSQKSINDGVNQLTTGTLTTSDLKNKANYDATSTGMSGGYGGSKVDPKTGQLSPNGVATSNTWNNINVSRPSVMGAQDSSNSTTYSGVSGGKITITDGIGQAILTGKTAEQAINELNRGVATGVDQSNTLEKIYDEASIKASFNITKQLNTEVGIFQANRAQNATTIKKMEEKGLDKLTKEERAQYDNAKKAMGDSDLWALGGKGTLVLNAISLAANGNVTGSGADLIRDSAVNYLQGLTAQQIKSIADALQSESARAALHAIAACAGAAAKQGDCGSAALGAGASVILNNALDKLLATNADDMTSAEKDARVNLISSIIAGITQAAGGDAAMANAGSRIEMENNRFSTDKEVQIVNNLVKAGYNQDKLNAAACALIKCYAQYPVGSEEYNKNLALANEGEQYKDEQNLLKNTQLLTSYFKDPVYWNKVPDEVKYMYQGFDYGQADQIADGVASTEAWKIGYMADLLGVDSSTIQLTKNGFNLVTQVGVVYFASQQMKPGGILAEDKSFAKPVTSDIVRPNQIVSNNESVRVGRWMSEAEYNAMITTGKMQEGSGGLTFVSTKGITDFQKQAPKGSVYIEFDLPKNSLVKGGQEGWYKTIGPNAKSSQKTFLNRQGGDILPEFENISEILRKK